VGSTDKGDRDNAISPPVSSDNLINRFYLRPMIGNDLLGKSEYDVEIVKWIDGSADGNKVDKIVVALPALEDVVVMNQKRVSQSTGYASYGRSRYHIAGAGGSRSME
jgi:hypothetical protein